jgi:hypothetical protein
MLLVTVVLIVGAGGWLWSNLFRREPLPQFASDEMQFKYGALGYGTLGKAQGFPLPLWRVMPEVFADKLPGPGGWAAFGFVIEKDMEYPVGFAKVTVGYPGLVPNCALCHSGTVRTAPGEEPRLILGAPAHQFDFDAFNDFIYACANDPRFTVAELLPHMEKTTGLSASERMLYRLLIPAMARQIQAQEKSFAWQHSRPKAGCGRTDAFNRFKINVLKSPDDGSIGTSDYPPLWNQERRAGLWLHWNGSGNSLHDEDLLSVFPIIKGPGEFDAHGFERVTGFLRALQPPRFPFALDAGIASRGEAVFAQHCADCHAFGGAKLGQVTSLKEVGTDPAFLGMWTTNFVERLKAINSPPFRFPATRVTDGYVNVPLDGLWLRAPYLHNGSVPTLAALLQPPEQRPKVFYRGSDVYDPEQMGFRSGEPTAGERGFRYDTALPGNGNQGHTYGTDLPADEKRALLEYLKTL